MLTVTLSVAETAVEILPLPAMVMVLPSARVSGVPLSPVRVKLRIPTPTPALSSEQVRLPLALVVSAPPFRLVVQFRPLRVSPPKMGLAVVVKFCGRARVRVVPDADTVRPPLPCRVRAPV